MLTFWTTSQRRAVRPKQTPAELLLRRTVPCLSPAYFYKEEEQCWGFVTTSERIEPLSVYLKADGDQVVGFASADLYFDRDWQGRGALWDLLEANAQLKYGSYRLVKNHQGYCVVLGVTVDAQHWSELDFVALVRTQIEHFESTLLRLYAKDLIEMNPVRNRSVDFD